MWHGRTSRIERPPIAEINARAATLRARGEDLIDLGQAILGLPPPAAALQAVREFLQRREPHGYSPDPGLPEVRERVARFLRERKHLGGATARSVLLTCGANQAFVNTLFALTQPSDEVVFFGPSYFDHCFAIELADCVPVEVGLVRSGPRFTSSWEALEAAITPRTRCLVLVSPANPPGMVLDEDDVRRLCELCRKRGIWLISDETYDLFVFPPKRHISPAALGIHDQVVVVGSFSKTFGLAGWRIGYLHGPPELVEETIKVQDTIVVCAPVPSQLAMAAALDVAEPYCTDACAELVRRRDILLEGLSGVGGLDTVIPDGATFLMVRTPGEASSVAWARDLVDQAHVVTVPGVAFGQHGEGYIRMSFGNQPVPRLEEAVTRLRRFCASR